MLGFRYLHTRYKNWFRAIWALLLFFFLGLTIYQSAERIMFYFVSNPLNTKRVYDTPTRMHFPTVVICNKMQLKSSRLAASQPSLLAHMCGLWDDDGRPVRNESLWESLGQFDHINVLDVYKQSRQTVEDLFIGCEYGKGEQCFDDIRPIRTQNGLCFAVSPNLTVQRPGPETTLSLLLNLEVYETIPGTVVDPGVILSLYDKQEMQTSHYTEGVHLEPGKQVTIPINDVRRLRRHRSECRHSRSLPRAACQWASSSAAVQRKCGCVPANSATNSASSSANVSSSDSHPTAAAASANSSQHAHRQQQQQQHHQHEGKLRAKNASYPCTVRQELRCADSVSWHEDDPDSQSSRGANTDVCAEDCTEVSFTTIVFGNQLLLTEISSLLPSDWEDEKEKRLAAFQTAYDIIPKNRIPIVQNIKRLADEARNFLDESVTVLSIGHDHQNGTWNACDLTKVETHLHHMHSMQRVWKNVQSYAEMVFTHHIGSLLSLLNLKIVDRRLVHDDGSFTGAIDKGNSSHYEDSFRRSVQHVMSQLESIEFSLQHPYDVYGLRNIEGRQLNSVANAIRQGFSTMRECISKMTNGSEKQRKECSHLLDRAFSGVFNAQTAASLLSPLAIMQHMNGTSRLAHLLHRLKFVTQPKIFSWHTHDDVNLRAFDSAYREGGKEIQDLLELLKMRKAMHADSAQAMRSLADHLDQGVHAAVSSAESFGLENITDDLHDQIHGIKTSATCLRSLATRIEALRKRPFMRADWQSRLQRAVTLAQSYSAGAEYDEVNLLFVRIYFAHFKQELITQERSYNLFLLLAEIGGTIGLYVGATLLTVAETIVFFFERKTRASSFILKPVNV